MSPLVLALTATLLALAVLHLAWGFGLWWPLRDERALVSAVVGVKGADRMPGPIPCLLVAGFCVVAALWPWLPPGWLRQAGLFVLADAFLLRGVMPWLRPWRRVAPQEPFARLDRALYGPLCLLLAGGFSVLLFNGFDHA